MVGSDKGRGGGGGIGGGVGVGVVNGLTSRLKLPFRVRSSCRL
jgi:hypothetical protein